MGPIFGFVFHVLAIYFGTQIAQIEYADIWRCVTIGLISYIAMFLVGLLLLPLILVPVLNMFFGAIVLGLGTAFATKIVLSTDWQPAWTVGITVAVINLLVGWALSGCS